MVSFNIKNGSNCPAGCADNVIWSICYFRKIQLLLTYFFLLFCTALWPRSIKQWGKPYCLCQSTFVKNVILFFSIKTQIVLNVCHIFQSRNCLYLEQNDVELITISLFAVRLFLLCYDLIIYRRLTCTVLSASQPPTPSSWHIPSLFGALSLSNFTYKNRHLDAYIYARLDAVTYSLSQPFYLREKSFSFLTVILLHSFHRNNSKHY